jgi:hypothetical protein
MVATVSRRWSKIATAILALLAHTTVLEAAQPRGTDLQLERAFVAVFGQPSPVVRQAVRPGPTSSDPNAPSRSRVLRLVPSLLVDLSHKRYALVIEEVDDNAGHAYPGAIAIGYLCRGPKGWSLEKLWPELAWTGNTGRPVDTITTLPFGSPRMVVVSSSYTGQGQTDTTDWVIRLGNDQPSLLGGFTIGGSVPSGECEACGSYSFQGLIKPPQRPGDVFSVKYEGWTVAPGKNGPRTPFRAQTGYSRSKAGLSARPPVTLPN